jgi:hypothetical protein
MIEGAPERIARDGVRGFLHRPAAASAGGIVLTHGAGSNADAPLLVRLSEQLAKLGFTVLRCDLPFRQARPHGPPSPAHAERDREGLGQALAVLREYAAGRIFLGGHSYGGRQASILAAANPEAADALLLLSYPLYPPGQPGRPRTQHFSGLRTPALFVHGTRDPFGTVEELRAALRPIPAHTELLPIEGTGHDLGRGARAAEIAGAFQAATAAFFAPGEGSRRCDY